MGGGFRVLDGQPTELRVGQPPMTHLSGDRERRPESSAAYLYQIAWQLSQPDMYGWINMPAVIRECRSELKNGPRLFRVRLL
jgi:hypothetical protein